MTKSTATENLLDWLRDAHAMEQQAEKMLSAQAERLEHYPDLKARIVQHIDETRGQRELLESCLQRLGSSPSTFKDLSAKVMAFGQAVAGMAVSDEVVKGAMSGYVFENMEIASYTVLIAAAREAGDSQTQTACEQILKQEVAMAEWLREHLPQITVAFLQRSASPDLDAKR
ncbi:ferritin-like domain-containing protein [Ectopseudomonas guguanensis]|uniref:ferritin-like domain-containing protein n=1 Tax=Ectopseudomonas guguanensis TaxID=1198456 RepID=UPI0028AE36FF|nr:ferritin-like domain-containing protein [Pseudomonas guguanensis]